MEQLLIAVLVSVIAQTGLMWYRLGKTEQKLDDLCNEVRKDN